MDKKYDIFISYRRTHSLKVEHIYDELKGKFRVFFDQEGIHTGEIFENKILSALSVSKVLLLVLTKDACNEFKIRSKDSDWLIKEITYAKDNNIPILPIIIYNEEDAKEVNLLINKELQQCIPNDISFLPQMQFNKIRLERKARKSDINNLINEIEQGLYNKEIIETIRPTNNLDKQKSNKKVKLKYLILLLISITILIAGYFLYDKKLNLNILNREVNINNILTSNKKTNISKSKILLVTNKINSSAKLKQQIHIDSNKTLIFYLNYDRWNKGVKNIRVFLEDLNGLSFKKNENITIKGIVVANNVEKISDKVNIIFDENVTLKFDSIHWQKNNCTSFKCDTPLLENYKNLFSNKGLYLGNLPENNTKFSEHLVIIYKVIKHKKKKKYTYKMKLTSPTSIPPLQVNVKRNSVWNGWKLNESIREGDKVVFQIHVYAKTPLHNIKVKFTNLNVLLGIKNQTAIVKVELYNNNTLLLTSFVEIHFEDTLKLNLETYKLAIKNQNEDNYDEYFIRLPNNQNILDIYNKGIFLEDIDIGYRENLLLLYSANKRL